MKRRVYEELVAELYELRELVPALEEKNRLYAAHLQQFVALVDDNGHPPDFITQLKEATPELWNVT